MLEQGITRAQTIWTLEYHIQALNLKRLLFYTIENQHYNEVGYHHFRPIKKSQRKVTKNKETPDNPTYTRKIPNQRQLWDHKFIIIVSE